MKLEILGYVPPKGVGFPESFLRNLSAYKTTFPVTLFSDYPDWGLKSCDNPARLKNPRQPHWVSNFTFLVALQYAISNKLDAFLFIEPDVRVRGDNWDGIMVEEALSFPGFACAGSPVIYNVSGSTHSALKLATEYCYSYLRSTGLAVPIYGFRKGLALYTNGAGAIYNTEIIGAIFRGFESDMGRFSCQAEAWDIKIGTDLFQIYGDAVFNMVAPLTSSFSGCTDDLVTWDERRQMLESGSKVLIHQCKTADTCI